MISGDPAPPKRPMIALIKAHHNKEATCPTFVMKKFINEKVTDWKFKKAGDGHSLSEERKLPDQSAKASQAPRSSPSGSSRSAGSAALARFDNQHRRDQPRTKPRIHGDASSGATAGGVSKKRAVCSQVPSVEETVPKMEVVDLASNSIIVHVICPLCQRSIPEVESHQHLNICLEKEISQEPLTGSVLMINTLCQDQEKRHQCVDTITKYLDNILAHPGEEKYCKIRISNKIFQDRVTPIQGSLQFMKAIGFEEKTLPHQDKGEESFLVLSELMASNTDDLAAHKEILTSAQPLVCAVDRNLQVFLPSFQATRFTLPDSFFRLTVSEIKQDQRQKSEALERESVLRTKAMKERDAMKMSVRHYRFVLLRVRMPDGYIVQGIFRPLEKLSDVRSFISDTLRDKAHVFSLSVLGKSFSAEDASLAALELVPSALLNFTWDTSMGPTPDPPCLRQDLLERVQGIP